MGLMLGPSVTNMLKNQHPMTLLRLVQVYCIKRLSAS